MQRARAARDRTRVPAVADSPADRRRAEIRCSRATPSAAAGPGSCRARAGPGRTGAYRCAAAEARRRRSARSRASPRRTARARSAAASASSKGAVTTPRRERAPPDSRRPGRARARRSPCVRAAIAVMRPSWPPPRHADRGAGQAPARISAADCATAASRRTSSPRAPARHAREPRAQRRVATRRAIEAASSAAFAAPGFPMASVPTGTPAGICTMLEQRIHPVAASSPAPARRAPARASWPAACQAGAPRRPRRR